MKNNIKNFEKNGYVLVKNALSKETVDLVTQYALFDEIQDYKPDGGQVIGAHAKYADPVMESLLLQLQSIIENNTGLSVHPTYSYYRVYRPGDELKPHKDRQSCEISITLSLGYDYCNSNYKWPIYIEGQACVLEPGDIVCYKGIELEHWREKFIAPENSWHVQAFLHYVDSNGPFSEYSCDLRDSIGYPFENRDAYKLEKLNQKTENIMKKLQKINNTEIITSEQNIKKENKKSYITYVQ